VTFPASIPLSAALRFAPSVKAIRSSAFGTAGLAWSTWSARGNYDNSDNIPPRRRNCRSAGRTGGTFLHSSRTNPDRVAKSNIPAFSRTNFPPKNDLTPESSRISPGSASPAHPHRGRRHPQLRRSPAQGRLKSSAFPKDHGHDVLAPTTASASAHASPAPSDG